MLVRVEGTVQGVGFRPFVFRLAMEMGLKGFVRNTADGVVIEIEGGEGQDFIERMRADAPPLSKITGVSCQVLPHFGYEDFRILESRHDGRFFFSPVCPDISVCDDCLREMRAAGDRRHLYPFINCTNCGPRYSIIERIPYDRANTTMKAFTMCPECEKEYKNPMDRRFHAEPDACPVCGPSLTLVVHGEPAGVSNPIETVCRFLIEGKIVAIKGIGGFHLVCDALNPDAVQSLRERKRKNNKPFALMAGSVKIIRKFCEVGIREETLLRSVQRPVVLLEKKNPCAIPDAVAPKNRYIGFMLPYTPLHWMLFDEKKRLFEALVMTSANISEEPIVIDNAHAMEALSGLADAFLLHNRDIHTRVDDSVIKPAGKGTIFIRRARGFAPGLVKLPGEGPEVIGAGADLKNTFTLTKGDSAIPSQHIGDMENPRTLVFYEETLEKLKNLYRVRPEAIAFDLHPGYFSTSWAQKQDGLVKIGIQHHYAHIASVMAEKGLRGPCVGVAFDGTGYGTDGTLWGGEFLAASIDGFERAGHVRPFPLPGGEQAIREPWKAAIGIVKQAANGDALSLLSKIKPFISRHNLENIKVILDVCDRPVFSPLSSGAGRLFDAVSALLGLTDVNTFEGEAAISLESGAEKGNEDVYPVDIGLKNSPLVLDFSVTILEIINDIIKGRPVGLIAAKFHNAVAAAIVRTVERISMDRGIRDIVLSGGVFQNSYLLSSVLRLFPSNLRVFVNEAVPSNDGGISLGQAYILRERMKKP